MNINFNDYYKITKGNDGLYFWQRYGIGCVTIKISQVQLKKLILEKEIIHCNSGDFSSIGIHEENNKYNFCRSCKFVFFKDFPNKLIKEIEYQITSPFPVDVSYIEDKNVVTDISEFERVRNEKWFCKINSIIVRFYTSFNSFKLFFRYLEKYINKIIYINPIESLYTEDVREFSDYISSKKAIIRRYNISQDKVFSLKIQCISVCREYKFEEMWKLQNKFPILFQY